MTLATATGNCCTPSSTQAFELHALVVLMAAWTIGFSGLLHAALPAALRNGRTYLERSLRCFFGASSSAGRARASSACLASLSARRRSMFLRIAAALCSTSIIARVPSSWANCGKRLSRFPAYHLSGSRLASEQTRSILGSSGQTAISVYP